MLEIMDRGVRSYEETAGTYRLIRRVNRFLFGTRVILSHLKCYSKRWSANSVIRILDVGSGAVDIPQTVVRWARRKGHPIWIVALDLNPQAMVFAQGEIEGYPEIRLIRASAFEIPFRDLSFDYVISSMFFHHLKEAEVIRVLREFDRVTKRGIVVNDLLRRLRAYLWILFLSRFTQNEIFRNDAPLSVLRGYRRREVEAILDEAGLPYLRFYYHFGHRFAVAGEKVPVP